MNSRPESTLVFLARYSIYAILPGMWFAYIAGVSPWWGAAGGLTAIFLIVMPSRLLQGLRNGKHPDPQ